MSSELMLLKIKYGDIPSWIAFDLEKIKSVLGEDCVLTAIGKNYYTLIYDELYITIYDVINFGYAYKYTSTGIGLTDDLDRVIATVKKLMLCHPQQ